MSVSFQAQSKPSRKEIWCLKVFLTEDVWHNGPGIKHRHKRKLPKKLPSTRFLDCFLHLPLGWRSRRWTGIFQFEVLYLFVALKFHYIIRKVAVPLTKWIDANSHRWEAQKPGGKRIHRPPSFPNHTPSSKFYSVLDSLVALFWSTKYCLPPTPDSDSRVHLYLYKSFGSLACMYFWELSISCLGLLFIFFCVLVLPSEGYPEQTNAFTSSIYMSNK